MKTVVLVHGMRASNSGSLHRRPVEIGILGIEGKIGSHFPLVGLLLAGSAIVTARLNMRSIKVQTYAIVVKEDRSMGNSDKNWFVSCNSSVIGRNIAHTPNGCR